MRSKNLKSVNPFTYVIVCTLVLLMTVTPVINTLIYIEDSNYVFAEQNGEVDSKEKEIIGGDDENKEPKLITSNLMNQNRFMNISNPFFDFQKSFTGHNPDIYLPPPRQ